MTSETDLTNLIRRVMAATESVDQYIMKSDFICQDVLDLGKGQLPNGHDKSDPEKYLQDEDLLHFWDQYFEHVMHEWDADRMSNMKINSIIERLSAPAASLDHYSTKLVKAYRALPNVPEERINSILKRHSALNAFLNSADIGVELWRRNDGIPLDSTSRRRRPIPHVDGELPSETSQDDAMRILSEPLRLRASGDPSRQRPISNQSINSLLRGLNSGFKSNATLISLTSLVTLTAGLLQVHSLDVSIRTNGITRGRVSDPDFYSTLQNSLMQLLSLYVLILPALRHQQVRRVYTWWTWILGGGSAICVLGSMGSYVLVTAAAPLLGFLGAALQAFVVLQLIWVIDSGVRKDIKDQKGV